MATPIRGTVTESAVIDGWRVDMMVRIVSRKERARIGASIVSASLLAFDGRLNHAVSRELLEDVVAKHVAFTVEEQALSECEANWWSRVLQEALTVFLRINGLTESVRRAVHSAHHGLTVLH